MDVVVDEAELTAELLRVAPREFVAARNAKVAALRAAGARDVAAGVAKLRRPRPEQWALNVVAHTDPELVERWLVAAGAVRDAQDAAAAGTRRSDLRELLAELRHRTGELVAAVPPGSPVAVLPTELAEVAGSADTSAAFRAGLLGAGLEGALPTAPASSGAATGRRTKSSSRKRQVSTDGAAGQGSAEAEARRRLTAAAAKLADAESASASASDGLEVFERELAAADEAVAEARRALEAAEGLRRDTKARSVQARRQHVAATKRLDTARRAHALAADQLAAIRRNTGD